MPELPDVEYFRRYLDATALHRPVTGLEVYDRQVLEGVTTQRLRRLLRGRCLERTRRHGKYLFVATDGPESLVFHFGMTGRLRYFKHGGAPPRHTRVLIEFDRHRLAYISQRKLGLVGVTADVDGFIEARRLGPDALRLDPGDLRRLAGHRRGGIKALLMNQSLIAGLGNVYSDEILFHAGICPRRAVRTLTPDEVTRLHRDMHAVLRTAVRIVADPRRLPQRWLLGHRHSGARCPRCGHALRRAAVAGRSSYYCSRCQS